MKLRDLLVPDEIQSAAEAASDMLGVVRQTSHFWLKQAFAAFVPLLLGYALGIWLIDTSTLAKLTAIKDIVAAVLTLASVLAGFMVTLMLFTGRTSGTKVLTADQAPAYVEKIIYLLFSQALTLIVHILCILVCVGWLVVYSVSASSSVTATLFALAAGFLTLSLFRTLLLPFQIYEVHQFELSAMVEEKNRQFMKELEEQDRDL